MIRKKRQSDPENDNSYKKRVLIDFKTILQLIIFLIGGGAAGTGLTYLTPTTPQLEVKIHDVEKDLQSHKNSFNNYKEYQEREIDLQIQNIDIKLHAVNNKIDDLKEDIKEIKQLIRDGN